MSNLVVNFKGLFLFFLEFLNLLSNLSCQVSSIRLMGHRSFHYLNNYNNARERASNFPRDYLQDL